MAELTKKELEELELQAMQEVEDEEKEALKAQALASAKAKIKAKAKEADKKSGGKGAREVLINLGKHADRVTIDGRTFMHGHTYPLTHAQECAIKDMAFRTHLHQAERLGGKWLSDFYGKKASNKTI